MGKDLRGKELGVGISQRKDGLYTARFTDKSGKRRQQYFKKLQECRNWLADAQFADEHGDINASSNMTVDAWFEYWISEIKEKTVRWSTLSSYKDRYNKNIKEIIGKMIVSEVKPMHCQNVLNVMDNNGYAGASMERTKVTLSAMFSDACENGLISSNPVTKSVKCPKKKNKNARVLTVDEQKRFLESAKENVNYNHFLFVLQTGVRSSELRGLKWGDIDFENRIIHIRRNVAHDSNNNRFITGELKTSSGQRDIPMTQAVYNLLLDIKCRQKNKQQKVVSFEFSDHIFLNRNGKLIPNSNYDRYLEKLCIKSGIEKISMHTLRHTFATRCIESGMKPKTLQKILGHANISMTMDLYVHVTEDEKEKEMKKFEEICSVV
ncbi:MAG: tyrosine-type recombinase/integrase [Lachnospiraceae bacterium]|nr:tyrosine-type recombinase/integrase [Lachnospiraceae bacterium]